MTPEQRSRANARARAWYWRNRERAVAKGRKWRSENKERLREIDKRFKRNNPDYARARMLLRRYGITLSEYSSLWESQSGLCAICGNPETAIEYNSEKVRVLSVDHDHSSGAIRGLLCHACNVGIGHFNDDPNLLSAALSYLNRKAGERAA